MQTDQQTNELSGTYRLRQRCIFFEKLYYAVGELQKNETVVNYHEHVKSYKLRELLKALVTACLSMKQRQPSCFV